MTDHIHVLGIVLDPHMSEDDIDALMCAIHACRGVKAVPIIRGDLPATSEGQEMVMRDFSAKILRWVVQESRAGGAA